MRPLRFLSGSASLDNDQFPTRLNLRVYLLLYEIYSFKFF